MDAFDPLYKGVHAAWVRNHPVHQDHWSVAFSSYFKANINFVYIIILIYYVSKINYYALINS